MLNAAISFKNSQLNARTCKRKIPNTTNLVGGACRLMHYSIFVFAAGGLLRSKARDSGFPVEILDRYREYRRHLANLKAFQILFLLQKTRMFSNTRFEAHHRSLERMSNRRVAGVSRMQTSAGPLQLDATDRSSIKGNIMHVRR